MKAFLDTTILVDSVLRESTTRQRTIAALRAYSTVQYPAYARKEFDLGALDAYRRTHNYLSEEKSVLNTLIRINRGLRTPQQNRFNTMLQAYIRALEETFGHLPPAQSLNDKSQARSLQLHLSRVVMRAHMALRKLEAEEVFPLSCYGDLKMDKLSTGLIIFAAEKCIPRPCAAGQYCLSTREDLLKLVSALLGQLEKRENSNRLKALRLLIAEGDVTHSECRHLGDAVFSILAPVGFVILTTNMKDHEPLAACLGKAACLP